MHESHDTTEYREVVDENYDVIIAPEFDSGVVYPERKVIGFGIYMFSKKTHLVQLEQGRVETVYTGIARRAIGFPKLFDTPSLAIDAWKARIQL